MRETMSPEERAVLKAKSLGEKLFDALYYDSRTKGVAWSSLPDRSRDFYEIAGMAFAASLSHDETAGAVIAFLTARAEGRARVLRAVQCQAENAAYNLGQPESGWCTKDATRAFHNISGTIEAALSSDSQEATHV